MTTQNTSSPKSDTFGLLALPCRITQHHLRPRRQFRNHHRLQGQCRRSPRSQYSMPPASKRIPTRPPPPQPRYRPHRSSHHGLRLPSPLSLPQPSSTPRVQARRRYHTSLRQPRTRRGYTSESPTLGMGLHSWLPAQWLSAHVQSRL